jgi:ribose transport system ATP-binding protein
VSFIYISHRLEEIARIGNRIVVLRDGRLVATHASAQVPVNVLLENMVGRNVDRIFPKIEEPTGKEVLRVEGLTGANGALPFGGNQEHRRDAPLTRCPRNHGPKGQENSTQA